MRRYYNVFSFISISLISILLISILLLLGCGPKEEPLSEDLTIGQLAILNQPAVVLIYSTWSGDIVGSSDHKAILSLWHDGQPFKELSFPSNWYFGSQGTGFVINPEGYIVTNAHVVSKTEEQIESTLLRGLVNWGIKNFPKYYVEAGFDPWPATNADVEDLWAGLRENFEVINLTEEFVVKVGQSIGGTELIEKGYRAEVRKVSPSQWKYVNNEWTIISGKDLAIIKIEGKNYPSMILGDSEDMTVGDEIMTIGYPGAVVEHSYLSESSRFDASVTSGIISADRTAEDGSPIFQTDASITHGNSGGPAINSDGEVIGVTTFATSGWDPSLGEYKEIQGFNFLVASNSVKELIKELNIENVQGVTDEHYKKAMIFFYNKRYEEAVEEFNIVNNLFPGHPYANDFITTCQEKMLEVEN